MIANSLFDNAHGQLRWLSDVDTKRFMAACEHELEVQQKRLEAATVTFEIHRAQGEIAALRQILNLKQALRGYEADVRSGKANPGVVVEGKV